MGIRNDLKLAESVSDIDLILGGHDHKYMVQKVEKEDKRGILHVCPIIKSGSDFEDFSEITL